MNTPTIPVRVAGRIIHYPLNIEGLGDHIAGGGRVADLPGFVESAKRTLRSADWALTVTGWVWLDDSGLAYEVEVSPSGSYRILSAAPRGALRDVYDAKGYDV